MQGAWKMLQEDNDCSVNTLRPLSGWNKLYLAPPALRNIQQDLRRRPPELSAFAAEQKDFRVGRISLWLVLGQAFPRCCCERGDVHGWGCMWPTMARWGQAVSDSGSHRQAPFATSPGEPSELLVLG